VRATLITSLVAPSFSLRFSQPGSMVPHTELELRDRAFDDDQALGVDLPGETALAVGDQARIRLERYNLETFLEVILRVFAPVHPEVVDQRRPRHGCCEPTGAGSAERVRRGPAAGPGGRRRG
jgi:hypothetical protein